MDLNYYDNLGQVIQYYKQHYLGGVLNDHNYDVLTVTYNFNGQPVSTLRQHWNSNNTSAPLAMVSNTYVYDHMGRKKQNWEQINTDANTLLTELDYNEIGQLMTKNLHGTGTASGGQVNGDHIVLDSADAVPSGNKTVTASSSIALTPGFYVATGASFSAQLAGYLQSVHYTYNERGWLQSGTADLF